jgi:hypothetical protein
VVEGRGPEAAVAFGVGLEGADDGVGLGVALVVVDGDMEADIDAVVVVGTGQGRGERIRGWPAPGLLAESDVAAGDDSVRVIVRLADGDCKVAGQKIGQGRAHRCG